MKFKVISSRTKKIKQKKWLKPHNHVQQSRDSAHFCFSTSFKWIFLFLSQPWLTLLFLNPLWNCFFFCLILHHCRFWKLVPPLNLTTGWRQKISFLNTEDLKWIYPLEPQWSRAGPSFPRPLIISFFFFPGFVEMSCQMTSLAQVIYLASLGEIKKKKSQLIVPK